MGLARHNARGQVRLGLSATAGSAVLYSAIVLFGVGAASPLALDAGGDRHASIVLLPRHVDTVSGSAQKLPQASPEPGRQRSRLRPHQPRVRVGSAPTSTAPSTVEIPPPAPPRATAAAPSVSVASLPTGPAALPLPAAPLPDVAIPTVPAPELPLPLPELPAPSLQLPG